MNGLVLGKFMPFHNGHIALIDFALANTSSLVILVCANKHEPIDGNTRFNWLKEYYASQPAIQVILTGYDETELSAASAFSAAASEGWANWLKKNFPATTVFISSEPYGQQVAANWGIQCLDFDKARKTVPVSATSIRLQPFEHWQYIPAIVRPYFVKKICVAGAESTGKSTLTERLAAHYQTSFVPEAARDIVTTTDECTIHDLYKIASTHARAIIEKIPTANKLLFVDTDITITKSYGHFLFNTAIITEDWIEEANRFDLYLFLETDCPHVQDGTRLNEAEREKLNRSHKKEFAKRGITYQTVSGDWQKRFETSIHIIDTIFFKD